MSGGFMCALCNVQLNSDSQYAAHLSGKKHLQKLRLNQPSQVTKPQKNFNVAFVKSESENVENCNLSVEHSASLQTNLVCPPLHQLISRTQESPPPPPPPPISRSQESPPPPPPPKISQSQESPPPPRPPKISRSQELPPPPPPPQQYVVKNPIISTVKSASLPSTPLYTPVSAAVLDNALGKLPTKRKITTGCCEICKIYFNSESQAQAHYQGGKHAKKMKQTAESQSGEHNMCPECGVSFNSDSQRLQHLNSENHKKKLASLNLGAASSATNTGNPESNINTDNSQTKNNPNVSSAVSMYGSCEYCVITYNSESHKNLHINSKKHKKYVALAKGIMPGNVTASAVGTSVRKQMFFSCQFCGVMLNSLQQLEAHREGQKHKDQVNKHKSQGKKVNEREVTTVVNS